MAKRQSGLDLNKYVVMGMQAELEVLKAAQAALEAQLRRFNRGRSEPGTRNDGGSTWASAGEAQANGGTAAGGRRKRTRSAAVRKRMSEAQKARWAKRRGPAK